MKNSVAVAIVVAVMGCAPQAETAQTDTQPVDTLEAATDTLPSRDSVPSATATQTKTVTPATTSTKTAPQTTTKGDSIIGYDKVTPFDPTKRRLDTVKKRP